MIRWLLNLIEDGYIASAERDYEKKLAKYEEYLKFQAEWDRLTKQSLNQE